jgi:hypothetical protein
MKFKISSNFKELSLDVEGEAQLLAPLLIEMMRELFLSISEERAIND